MIINNELFNILIVDDDLNNLNVLTEMLAEQNYKIRRAKNGTLALLTIDVMKPDLILLDIQLPDINGYEICKMIKNNYETRDISIIFVSALNESFDKVKAFELGSVDYITKPFEIAEVLARVKNQLRIESARREIQVLNMSLEEKVESRTAQLESAKDEILKLLIQERESNEIKSNFIQMISHEFRTPLTSFLSSIEILENYK
ncbi:MAG: response regulator [Thermosynechococcaceae cyanobacterium]